MSKLHTAGCLVAAALWAAPAVAQTAPAPGQPAIAAGLKVSTPDFVNKAANSGLFEIQSSQLALDKSQDDRIRTFAQHMIRDHTAAGEKLKAAAAGQTVPTTLDQEHADMLQQLRQASGADFTRSYVGMQFDGHQQAVVLFESYAQDGDNAQLKQFAQQTVPTLREHLQEITAIRNRVATAQAGQPQTGASNQRFLTQEQPGHWRASKLEGLDVYNDNNEKIGDVGELIVDGTGKIEAVVIGVGGFLGLGEHDVAVPFDQIELVLEPRINAVSNTGTGGATSPAPVSPTAPNATGSTNPVGVRSTPDHAILKMTKDQLKAAPEFKYAR